VRIYIFYAVAKRALIGSISSVRKEVQFRLIPSLSMEMGVRENLSFSTMLFTPTSLRTMGNLATFKKGDFIKGMFFFC